MDIQITCINKPHRDSPHEHITDAGGAGWRWAVEKIIQRIEDKTDTFYTLVGKRAEVEVRTNPTTGRKFIQTHADGQWNNNLLALSACPLNL